jgi:hypothetical protein
MKPIVLRLREGDRSKYREVDRGPVPRRRPNGTASGYKPEVSRWAARGHILAMKEGAARLKRIALTPPPRTDQTLTCDFSRRQPTSIG